MSRFLKPVDYNDSEDKSRLVKARPIDPKFARKLGSYAAGKDFVTGSVQRESNVKMENSPNAGEIREEKTGLEQRNKLGAKILKAKLQGKVSLIEKLEKQLHALTEDGPGHSSTCKILFRTDGGDVRIPVTMKQERKDLKSRGKIVTTYHADKSIYDMVAEEKETTSAGHIFNAVKAAAKHRTEEEWVIDDAVMSIKRSRMREEKEQKRNRNSLIKGSTNITDNDSTAFVIIISHR
ncbi:hypothetical protein WUBG_01130 [Wuchereria bancrofti]|uniref:Uncharacterized protein n=1 Tax=Wuchereria bancrofti TaxID=6293 RepID=J9BKG2_WUCBA|nr:hypothetical protein WUBG_01130 [Wuchereria bancrofti]VDM08243.1 unnamed protein product [Wuchereria bancrofti]